MTKWRSRLVAAAVAVMIGGTANATVLISATAGTDPYSGPTPTYDFDSSTPTFTGGAVITTGTTAGLYAQPFGSSGNYYSVGPSTSSPGDIDLTAFATLQTISFIWGSVDTYNTLQILDSSLNVLASFTGTDVFNPANGDQTNPNTNPLVTLTFSGSESTDAAFLRLGSTQNAFEIDNISISAVPEPAAWLLMLFGFGAVGTALRRRRGAGRWQLA